MTCRIYLLVYFLDEWLHVTCSVYSFCFSAIQLHKRIDHLHVHAFAYIRNKILLDLVKGQGQSTVLDQILYIYISGGEGNMYKNVIFIE